MAGARLPRQGPGYLFPVWRHSSLTRLPMGKHTCPKRLLSSQAIFTLCRRGCPRSLTEVFCLPPLDNHEPAGAGS